MRSYISLLRGINVGGQKKLHMESLREIYKSAGFYNVQTYLQSGNVIFETPENDLPKLTTDIETLIQQTCGYRVEVFIRSPSEFEQILQNNPFLKGRSGETTKLYVTFLYQAPAAATWVNIVIPPGISDEFHNGKQEVYLHCPNGYGKTKLANSFFERKLGVAATTRNWNTVQALNRLLQESYSAQE
jgi:uncharacterized protein (DUF1697 family)